MTEEERAWHEEEVEDAYERYRQLKDWLQTNHPEIDAEYTICVMSKFFYSKYWR